MKKRIFTLGVMALLFVACSVKEMDIATPTAKDAEEFFATIEDASTRVLVDEDLMVLWHADDRVSIFNKYTYNQQYRFTGNTGANSGSFTKVPNDDFVTGNALNSVYAIYPYKESTEISNQGVLTIDLPATQSYAENSFGIGANTMISCTEGNELLFKNLCGYIMLKLYGDDVNVKSISIKGNNDEPLAGKATVNASVDNAPSLTFDASATKEITLSFDTPVTLGATAETATTFWLVVPPTTFSKGITLTVIDENNSEFKKSTSASLQISRNTLKRLTFLQVTTGQSEAIVFADDIIKAHLVAAFDTNGDGELSYKEAASVKSEIDFQKALDSITGSSTFNEFQYFTGLTTIPNSLFSGWSNLSSIVLPNSIESIGVSAFNSCSNLLSIHIPESVTEVGFGAFSQCSNLSSINIPSGITRIETGVFNECTSLSSISIPDGVTSIGNLSFKGCYQLASISLPNSLSSIEELAFYNCSRLSSITIPEKVISLGFSPFAGCGKLTTVKVLATTPPNAEDSIFDRKTEDEATIYVPAESVDAYRSAKGWRRCASIQAIGTPQAVDLGLPSGVKWASFNLGATMPEEYGDYFAWGEISPKSSGFNPLNYKWFTLLDKHDGENGLPELYLKVNKYCSLNSDGYILKEADTRLGYVLVSIDYVLDKLDQLELEDDAARWVLGDGWRMPTNEEWKELIQECEWTPSTMNGFNGYIVSSKTKGTSVFIPCAGWICGDSIIDQSYYGDYWSSSSSIARPLVAKSVSFGQSGIHNREAWLRYMGMPIRPVCTK